MSKTAVLSRAAKSSAQKGIKSTSSRWLVNWRLLRRSALLVAVASVGIYVWWRYQHGRTAAALLARADQNEHANEWSKAAESLHRYVKLRPDDEEAHIRLAEAFDHAAVTPGARRQAVQLYATAIGLAPQRRGPRQRYAALLLEQGDFAAALAQCDELLQTEPDNAALLRIRAIAILKRHQSGDFSQEEVEKSLQQAVDHNLSDIPLAVELANFLRLSSRKADAADAIMDRLVDAGDNKASSYLARYYYRKGFAVAGADLDLEQAVANDPDVKDLQVRLTAANHALANKKWGEASEFFQQAIGIDKTSVAAYLGLGRAYAGQGKDELAAETWTRGLEAADGDSVDLLVQLAAVKIKLRDLEHAPQVVQRLKAQVSKKPSLQQSQILAVIDRLEASLAYQNNDYSAAIDHVRRALLRQQAGADSLTTVAAKAQSLRQLGDCYAALQIWDRAAASYEEAASLRPQESSLRLAAATSWRAFGHIDAAVQQFEVASQSADFPAAAWIDFAETVFRQRQTAAAAESKYFDQVFARAKEACGNEVDAQTWPPAMKLLAAENLARQGAIEPALDQLHAAEADVWASPDLIRRLAFDYEQLRSRDEADLLVHNWRQKDSHSLKPIMLEVDLHFGRGQQDKAEQLLVDAVEMHQGAERSAIRRTLAAVHLAQGKTEVAREELTAIWKDGFADRRVLALLCELAIESAKTESKHLAQAHQWEDELRKLEGEDGTNWRLYRAHRLLLTAEAKSVAAESQKRQALRDAEQLQSEVVAMRPNWPAGHLLKARLVQLQSPPDQDAAIHSYMQAVRLGERRGEVLEALVLLLYRQNRISEASEYLSRLQAETALRPEMDSLAMAIEVRQGKIAQAIALARKSVEQRADAASHIWLGELLALEGARDPDIKVQRWAEAEQELERARDMAPADLATWGALLNFYVGSDQIEKARELLDRLQANPSVPKVQMPFALAQGYARLGQPQQAERFYRQAIEQQPESVAVLLQAATFYQRQQDVDSALGCVDRALKREPDHHTAKQLKAVLLSSRGGSPHDIDSALSLLDRHGNDGALDRSDQRLKAAILLRRGGVQGRDTAQQMLETLVADAYEAAPVDRILLARLYEAKGQLSQAGEQLRLLTSRNQPGPDHLAAFVDFCLRHNRLDEAGDMLRKLGALEPETEHLRTVNLRAKWLMLEHREQEVAPLIENFVERKLSAESNADVQGSTLLAVGNLCDALGLDDADQYLQKAVELSPGLFPARATWLARHARLAEAINLCVERAARDSTSRPARSLIHALLLSHSVGEDAARINAFLAEQLERHPNDGNLASDVSTLRLFEGSNDEAIRLLRRALDLNPKNVQAMNNLAILLAESQPTQAEARDWIERAIALAGMSPELLDTKGMVLLCQGDWGEAETTFLEAQAAAPMKPTYQFHLAVVYNLQGKLPEARESLMKARDGKLDEGSLMPLETAWLDSLERALSL